MERNALGVDMAVTPFCNSCGSSFGVVPISGQPSPACQEQRFFGRLACRDNGVDVIPGVYWRPNKFQVQSALYSSATGGTIPTTGDFRDVSLTITAPQGCGANDDLRYVVSYDFNVDIIADSGQFNATFDFYGGAPPAVFPVFPVPWLTALSFGNHTHNSFSGITTVLVPAGTSRVVTARLHRDAGAVTWDSIEMALTAWGDYEGH